MIKTRRHYRRTKTRRHKRNISKTKNHRSRSNRRTRRGGSAKIDQTFVNDTLPYGEYRTHKGIHSGFQIRK